jgi:predicted  nucleic acid-binding Zn-ribbon protein
MEQLAHFQPVFLTILGIVFVVGIVVAIQQYIRQQFKPSENKVDSIENDIVALKVEQIREQEHLVNIKVELESIRIKIHELALGQMEIKTVLFGHDGSNGIKSEIRALHQDVKELSKRMFSLEQEDQ